MQKKKLNFLSRYNGHHWDYQRFLAQRRCLSHACHLQKRQFRSFQCRFFHLQCCPVPSWFSEPDKLSIYPSDCSDWSLCSGWSKRSSLWPTWCRWKTCIKTPSNGAAKWLLVLECWPPKEGFQFYPLVQKCAWKELSLCIQFNLTKYPSQPYFIRIWKPVSKLRECGEMWLMILFQATSSLLMEEDSEILTVAETFTSQQNSKHSSLI